MPAKKADSGYAALRGHIPKDLYKRFRIHCLERDVDNSQGLEDLLREYFESKDQQEQEVPNLKSVDRPTDPQAAEPTAAAKPTATATKQGRCKGKG
jgi:hypothetical protein